MNIKTIKFTHFFGLLVLLLAAGCMPAKTPPAPELFAGTSSNAVYEYFHWQEGLNLMIWHDANPSSSCTSSGSTEAPIHSVYCEAFTESGQVFNWQIESADGQNGSFVLNNQPYDLSSGDVFLIKTTKGSLEIQQLQRDLSVVAPFGESIIEFALKDADIAEFIRSTEWKTYTNDSFGLSFNFPVDWFGPDEVISDQSIWLEIGSDIVYPYGTDRSEQIYTLQNSYYVKIQYSKNDQNPYWMDTYQSLLNLQDGESISDARSLVIRLRQFTFGRFVGVEYISTLSETAQTEAVYIRQVVLVDDQSNILIVFGAPNNVEIPEGTSWRDVYRSVDEANMELFHQILDSITVE